jgi:hypothetical protein
MGNYNGRIRCGYCYEYGHNSRTCPEKKKRLEEQLEVSKANGSDSHADYYANRIAKMTGVNPETGEKRSRRNESWGRKCSYCDERGHNRRTCETLKKDLARYAMMTREARQEVRAWALQDGIGIGAMVKYKEYSYNDATLMMVEAIDLQATHARQRYYQVTLRPLSGVGRKQTVSVQSPEQRGASESRYASSIEVAGKLTTEQMAAQIDEEWVYADIDWKNPPAGIRQNVFEKGEGRVFHFWHEHD